MKRREFLVAAIGSCLIPVGIITLLQSCGGSSDGGGGYGNGGNGGDNSQGGNCLADGTLVNIQLLHTPNHTLVIPTADVAAGVQKTYVLEDNGSGHTHNVTLTGADFAMLQGNNGVVEVSTLSVGHTHNVTFTCA